MEIDKIIRDFKFFNEKAEKLDRFSFTDKIFNNQTGFKMSFEFGEQPSATSERHGPDEESIDAFLLTLRFFIQNNEEISLQNMSKKYEFLKSNPKIDSRIFDYFESYRSQINSYLDTPHHMLKFKDRDGNEITNRYIFDTFLYGNLAHGTSKPYKKEQYDEWKASAVLFPLIENAFVVILGVVLKGIFQIAELNKLAIKQLQV